MIELAVGALGSGAILLGLALATIGLYGMLRHPDIFEQLHAAGLVTGPAVILVLLASLASGSPEIITSGLLVVVFILVTSSLSTHVIALAAWRQRGAADRRGGVGGAETTVGGGVAPVRMRLLVAHDASPGSDIALTLTASLAWPDGTEVRVMGVTEGDLPPLERPDRTATPEHERQQDTPAAAARRLERPGLAVDHVMRGGDPVTAILDEAEAFDADLVVVGSRGLGRVRSLLTGSVASGVLDRAPCPVLVARGVAIRDVLLATDGSDESNMAADAVARWSVFEGVHLHVLTVATLAQRYWEIAPMLALREAAAKSRHGRIAAAAAARARPAGDRAVVHVRLADDAAAEIVAFAEARSIDLIVVGSRGRTGLRRTLLGSVTRDVLASTQASVLVVRSLR